MKQVEVSILGQVYMLGCPEGGETLLANAVAAVDKEMTAIRDSGKVKARERIAVLAALNLGYQEIRRRHGLRVSEGFMCHRCAYMQLECDMDRALQAAA